MIQVVRFADLERWDPPSEEQPAAFAFPTVLLGEAADVRLGVQVPRKGSKPKGVERPYLRAANIRRGFVDVTTVKQMVVSEPQAAALALQPDDILFVEGSGSVSEVGRAAPWLGASEHVIHQNSVIRARLGRDDLDRDFVVTWFNSRAGSAYVRTHATTTSGLFHIGAQKLAGAPVPVPDLLMQTRLVAAYRAGIDEAQRAFQESESLRALAWSEFVTALVLPTALTPTNGLVKVVSFRDLDRWDTGTDLSELLSTYPTVTLGDVADVRLGTQIPRKGAKVAGVTVPYLRAANVQRSYFNTADVRSMTVAADTASRLKIETNDILFVEGNSFEEVGRSAVWPGSDTDTIIQNSVVRARLTDERLSPKFVSAWFNSAGGNAYVRAHATTTSGSLWHIGAGKLQRAPLPVPAPEVQAALVESLEVELRNAADALERSRATRELAEATFANALLHRAASNDLPEPREGKNPSTVSTPRPMLDDAPI
ncbi:UNVERIFIED_CONTAM: hypothetical protein OHV15_07945 [Microbacterium sp. SLM126]